MDYVGLGGETHTKGIVTTMFAGCVPFPARLDHDAVGSRPCRPPLHEGDPFKSFLKSIPFCFFLIRMTHHIRLCPLPILWNYWKLILNKCRCIFKYISAMAVWGMPIALDPENKDLVLCLMFYISSLIYQCTYFLLVSGIPCDIARIFFSASMQLMFAFNFECHRCQEWFIFSLEFVCSHVCFWVVFHHSFQALMKNIEGLDESLLIDTHHFLKMLHPSRSTAQSLFVRTVSPRLR